MMLETVLSGWSVARLLSRSYAFVCSLLGLTAVGACLSGHERPSDAIIGIADALHIPAPSAIGTVSGWIVERGHVLTVVAVVLVVASMLWSAGFVARNPYDFDKVRGPATFWLGVTVVLEVGGRPALEHKLLPFVAPLVILVAASIALARLGRARDEFTTQPRRSVGAMLVALLAGVALALVMAPLAVLVGLGGMRRPGGPGAAEAA